jgi:group I intron endonuclease
MPNRKDGKGFVYRILNNISGKCYIGETGQSSVKKRWDTHLSKINKGSGCPALRDAIVKYGIENFTFEVICTCETLEERMEKEINYIKEYNSMVPNGYNILPGGHYSGGFIGKKHSEETKEKLRESSKKYYADREVRKKSSERAKISNKKYNFRELVLNSEKFKKAMEEGRVGAAKGSHHSEEMKEKIRECVKKYYEKLGDSKHETVDIDEHRKVMGKISGIKVCQYDKDNKLIKIHDSMSDAARSVGLKAMNSISRVIYGKLKTAGGFIWKKYEEPENPENVIEHV